MEGDSAGLRGRQDQGSMPRGLAGNSSEMISHSKEATSRGTLPPFTLVDRVSRTPSNCL